MPDWPRLSVLVPTLNEVEWVEYCLRTARAALDAADVDGEILVADGGSTDGTVERAERAGADEVLAVESEGRAAQLNAAAQRARGRIYLVIHADALVSPGLVDGVDSAIGEGADGGWAPVAILPEYGGASVGLDAVEWGINWRTRAFCTATGEQALFVRARVFEAIGGFADQSIMEGHALARRLRETGRVDLLDVPVRISGRRWERGGVVRTSLLMHAIRGAYELGVPPAILSRIWERFSAA
ncbi:MAG: glycosyltransferase family 2 protein [Bradymonadaceae bacterium]